MYICMYVHFMCNLLDGVTREYRECLVRSAACLGFQKKKKKKKGFAPIFFFSLFVLYILYVQYITGRLTESILDCRSTGLFNMYVLYNLLVYRPVAPKIIIGRAHEKQTS